MICDAMWDVGGERRVRNQRKLLQTNPCIIFDDVLPAPTAKTGAMYIDHNSWTQPSWQWTIKLLAACFLILDWHATSECDIVMSHASCRDITQDIVFYDGPDLSQCPDMSLSYHSGLFSPESGHDHHSSWVRSWSSFLLGRCSMFQKIEFSSFSVCLIHQIKLSAITQARGLPPQPTSAHPTSRASLGTSPGQWAPPA